MGDAERIDRKHETAVEGGDGEQYGIGEFGREREPQAKAGRERCDAGDDRTAFQAVRQHADRVLGEDSREDAARHEGRDRGVVHALKAGVDRAEREDDRGHEP